MPEKEKVYEFHVRLREGDDLPIGTVRIELDHHAAVLMNGARMRRRLITADPRKVARDMVADAGGPAVEIVHEREFVPPAGDPAAAAGESAPQ